LRVSAAARCNLFGTRGVAARVAKVADLASDFFIIARNSSCSACDCSASHRSENQRQPSPLYISMDSPQTICLINSVLAPFVVALDEPAPFLIEGLDLFQIGECWNIGTEESNRFQHAEKFPSTAVYMDGYCGEGWDD
jgi:hypothetical protein